MRPSRLVAVVFLFTFVGQCADHPRYPLKVSENRRYLVDQRGSPVLIHGDTAWSLITALTKGEAAEYLENRRGKGFNAIIVNLIEHKFNGPRTREGEGPFTTPGDFSAPNEKYFAHADWVLREARQKEIVVLLVPVYLGYEGSDEGWWEEVLANGPARCREFGAYVGRRYKDFENLVWVMGGDRNPGPAWDHVNALAQGIRSQDARTLITAHAAPERSAVDEYARGGWLDLNATYTYEIVHKKLLRDWRRVPVIPFVLFESSYEGEHNASALQIRRQAWWAILCGAAGQFLGNRPIWLFDKGWREAMESTGSRDMVHLQALFTSRDWHALIPDVRHEVVTAGLGEFNGLDYVAAARTAQRSTVIAYMPASHPVTVDLSQMSAERVVAWWFNPWNGEATAAGEHPAQGTRTFLPPAEGDWVLVLDDAAKRLSPPGRRSN